MINIAIAFINNFKYFFIKVSLYSFRNIFAKTITYAI